MENEIRQAMIRSIELMSKAYPVSIEIKCTEEFLECLICAEPIIYEDKKTTYVK